MTQRIQPAQIIGGPLGGKTYRPKTKWPLYLSDTGEILPPHKGDRVFGRVEHKGHVRTCYIMRRGMGRDSSTVTYVHSTHGVL